MLHEQSSPAEGEDVAGEKRQHEPDAVAPVSRWPGSSSGSRRSGGAHALHLVGPGKQGNDSHLCSRSYGHGCVSAGTCSTLVSSSRRSSCANDGAPASTRDLKSSLCCDLYYPPLHRSEAYRQHDHDHPVQRLVDDDHHVIASNPSPHLPLNSDIETASSWDQLRSKNRHDKMPGGSDGSVPGHASEKDHFLTSIPWKPLKWSRSGSLPSRGTGFFTLPDDTRPAISSSRFTPSQFDLSDNAAASLSLPCDEACPRKKQRLGWGQGLAKYEKQKIEIHEQMTGGRASTENKDEKKPVLNNETNSNILLEFTSLPPPAIAGCSLPDSEEKKCPNKADNTKGDFSSDSSCQRFPDCLGGFSAGHSGLFEISDHLNTLLSELFGKKHCGLEVSDVLKSSTLNELFLAKSNIMKELEVTEGEIDSFENQLRDIDCETQATATSPRFSLPFDSMSSSCKEHVHSTEEMKMPVSYGSCQDLKIAIHQDDASGLSIIPCMENGGSSSEAAVDISSTHSGMTLKSPLSDGFCSDMGGVHYNNYLEEYNNLAAFVMETNNTLAKEASKIFDKISSVSSLYLDVSEECKHASCRQSEPVVKEKLAISKSFLAFKEQALALKFRAYGHLWKDDMHLFSLRKYRSKSQKRSEGSFQSMLTAYQKRRSSRYYSDENLRLTSTMGTVKFVERLLSECCFKRYRNDLKMPALILDKKERQHAMFISNNALVEDPCAVEKERDMINFWTHEEKELFMENLVKFGKDFTKIASFLGHKTTADCIEFYYKNRKSECFEKVLRQMNAQKQRKCFTTFLVTSQKKMNRGLNALCVDMLEAKSVMPPGADMYDVRGLPFLRSQRSTEAPEAVCEATLSGALIGETRSSSVASFGELGDHQYSKKITMADCPFTSECSLFDKEDACSDDTCREIGHVDWTEKEKSAFINALKCHGKDFMLISKYVGTRTKEQCKIFFGKARKCLRLDEIYPVPEEAPRDAVEGSDGEDACALAMDSVICSSQSCSQLDALPVLGEAAHLHVDSKDEADGSTIEEAGNVIEQPFVVSSRRVKVVRDRVQAGDVGHSSIDPRASFDRTTGGMVLFSGASNHKSEAPTQTFDCHFEFEQGPEVSIADQCLPKHVLQVLPSPDANRDADALPGENSCRNMLHDLLLNSNKNASLLNQDIMHVPGQQVEACITEKLHPIIRQQLVSCPSESCSIYLTEPVLPLQPPLKYGIHGNEPLKSLESKHSDQYMPQDKAVSTTEGPSQVQVAWGIKNDSEDFDATTPLVCHGENKQDCQCNHCSLGVTEADEHPINGTEEFKLFGQIVPLKKLGISAQGNCGKSLSTRSQKSVNRNYLSELRPGEVVDSGNSYGGIEKLPLVGGQLQTCLPCLPERGILSTKCPGVVSTYHHIRRGFSRECSSTCSYVGLGGAQSTHLSCNHDDWVKSFSMMDHKMGRSHFEVTKQWSGCDDAGILGLPPGIASTNVCRSGTYVAGNNGVTDPVPGGLHCPGNAR